MNQTEIPITQSKSWAKLQEDLGEKSFLEQGNGYQYLAILKNTPLGSYLYLPYGPIYKTNQGLQNSLKTLKLLATREHAFFIRVEPINPDFAKHPPKNTYKTKDLSPKETWVLDLKGTDEDLKQKLPSRLLRYHKSAAKKGITITKSHNPSDIKYLLDLQRALAKDKGINTFSEEYLRTELSQPFATLYLVNYQPPESTEPPKIIAAGLVFDDKTTRYNLQGAQSDEGRKLHATGILTIELILDAKKKDLKTFDFWGIAPEGAGPDHPWAGFTSFKKTFAGQEVQHSGTYDIIINPWKYRLYKLIRPLANLKKH